ncbi:MAG: aminotransferase class V-fold PLP-dependent enzyme [Flavobacteriaceae bacterium]
MRNHFPILDQCLYLNTAYTAPLSSTLSKWRLADDLAYEEKGDFYKNEIEKGHFKTTTKALARFADAEVECTFITGNFSSAFQNFLIHLPRNFRFLVLEDEYPSLTGIVEDLGFESHALPLSLNIEEAVWEELHKVPYEVLTLSVIQYTSGLFFDMMWLEKIKKTFPSLIILIDGTQFLGAELFSLRESPIDAIFGSTYKWLLAGYGTGYAAIKSSLLSQLGISVNKLTTTYDRGQLSVKAVGSLGFSLNQIMTAGFPALIRQKQALANRMFEGLKKRSLLTDIVAQRKRHSSIYNLQITEEVYQGLLARKVRCIKRGNGVRVAIHHYNNTKDVNDFFEIIDELLK